MGTDERVILQDDSVVDRYAVLDFDAIPNRDAEIDVDILRDVAIVSNRRTDEWISAEG